MGRVMHLEAEGMLQEVAWLFARQAVDDDRALGDLHDLQLSCLRQAARRLFDLPGNRYPVGAEAAGELRGRADVAQFADADVPVVVRQAMGVGDRATGLAEQRAASVVTKLSQYSLF